MIFGRGKLRLGGAHMHCTWREIIGSGIFSVILSISLVVGRVIDSYEYDGAVMPARKMLILSIVISLLLFIPVLALMSFEIRENSKGSVRINRRLRLTVFAVIWIGGFLAWLALFPGGYDYDAPVMIGQYVHPDILRTSHFPPLFTFPLHLIVSAGLAIFKDPSRAVAMYTIIQMTFVSIVTTRITLFVYSQLRSRRALILSVLFFSIYPFHLLLQVSCVQDTFFACWVALFAIEALKFLRDKSCGRTAYIRLTAFGVLAALSRNNGRYALIAMLSIALLIFFVTKGSKYLKLVGTVLCVILISTVISKFVFGAFYKNVDSYNEMLSIPSQQLARVVIKEGYSLDKKDFADIRKFYPTCDFQREYMPSIADGIKGALDQKYFAEQKADYFSMWARIGKAHKRAYIEATALNTCGFWYPMKKYPDMRIFHPYIEYKISKYPDEPKYAKYMQAERRSKFPMYEGVLRTVLQDNAWCKIPLLSFLFTMGTVFMLYLYAWIKAICRRRYEEFISLSLYAGIYVTLLLGPVAIYRYNYFAIMSLPVLFVMLHNVRRTDPMKKSRSHQG